MSVSQEPMSFRKRLAYEELDMFDLFTLSFGLYRGNFTTFILLSFLCGIPLTMATIYFPLPNIDPIVFSSTEAFLSFVKTGLNFGFYINNILSLVFDVMLTISVALVVEAMVYKKTPQTTWALYGACLLFFPSIATRLIAIIFMSLGILAFVVPGVILAVFFMFSINATALRHTWGLKALGYSISLVRRKFFKSFLVMSFIVLFQNAVLLTFGTGAINTREGLLSYFLMALIYYPFNTYFKIIVTLFFLNCDHMQNEPKGKRHVDKLV